MNNDILVIGIAGGTGSGKTTLMNNIIETFGDVITVLSHDNYYKRHDDLTYEERCGLNYDEPAALETDLMARQLDQIRRDAASVQEKLTVEEELESIPDVPQPPAYEEAPADTGPLDKNEYRLLKSLLYGQDTAWVQREGLMLSVLVDGINEKLYDTFLDTVLDDTPAPIEDYIDELKEMVTP